MYCDAVTPGFICISNKAELMSPQEIELQKFGQRSYIVMLNYLCNATKKILNNFCFILGNLKFTY